MSEELFNNRDRGEVAAEVIYDKIHRGSRLDSKNPVLDLFGDNFQRLLGVIEKMEVDNPAAAAQRYLMLSHACLLVVAIVECPEAFSDEEIENIIWYSHSEFSHAAVSLSRYLGDPAF